MSTLQQEARDRLAEIKAQIAAGELGEREATHLISEIGDLLRKVQQGTWDPYPWQVAPGKISTMGMWLLMGGRGTGKTEAGSHYVDTHATSEPCDERIPGGHRMAIVAPTTGDAIDACFSGPSGIKTLNPSVELRGGAQGYHLIWPNGSTARLFGVFTRDDVERLRAGGNRCLVWMEELAAMRFVDEGLVHTRLGLRIGHNPHFIASTTPKPIKALRELVNSDKTLITTGRTRDAHHLAAEVRDYYFTEYGGTRLGRQELDAELLGDIEGALWRQEMIDADRVTETPPLVRTVIGVDPPGGATECGIVVVGMSADQHLYVLADLSGRYSPHEWAKVVVAAYTTYEANHVVAEKNYGGDMVKNTITSADGGEAVLVKEVSAHVGKQARAEPVVALYEKHWVHHVGSLPRLEGEQCEWVPASGMESPNRLDACVWACTDLRVRHAPATISNPARHAGAASTPRLPGSGTAAVVPLFGPRRATG